MPNRQVSENVVVSFRLVNFKILMADAAKRERERAHPQQQQQQLSSRVNLPDTVPRKLRVTAIEEGATERNIEPLE